MLKSICLSLYKFHAYTLHDSTRIMHWAMQVLHMLAVIQYPIHKLVSQSCKPHCLHAFGMNPGARPMCCMGCAQMSRNTYTHIYMFACMYNVMYACTCRSIYICTHAHGCSCDMFIWICMWYNSRHLSGLTIAHRGPGMPPHRVVCADHAPRTLRAHGCVI